MSETRYLPKNTPRSTGIERTTTHVTRPMTGGGQQGTSHVSSSPSAGRAAENHAKTQGRPAPANLVKPQNGGNGKPQAFATPPQAFEIPQYTEQEASLVAMLLVDFLRMPDEQIGPDARVLAQNALDKLGAAMGMRYARSDVARGAVPAITPPTTPPTPTTPPGAPTAHLQGQR